MFRNCHKEESKIVLAELNNIRDIKCTTIFCNILTRHVKHKRLEKFNIAISKKNKYR